MTTQAEVEQQQQEMQAVAALAVLTLMDQISASRPTSLAALRLFLMDSLTPLVQSFAESAAVIAADWYEAVRDAAGARGAFTPVLADLPPREQVLALAGWSTSMPKTAQPQPEPDLDAPGTVRIPEPSEPLVTSTLSPAQARSRAGSGDVSPLVIARSGTLTVGDGISEAELQAFQRQISGGMQRLIADAARGTIIGSSLVDTATLGWRRASGGDGDCSFCKLLIGRNAVYSKATVKFGAHDKCDCTAVAVFEGEDFGDPVSVDEYRPTDRKITDQDRARVRAWMKANGLT